MNRDLSGYEEDLLGKYWRWVVGKWWGFYLDQVEEILR